MATDGPSSPQWLHTKYIGWEEGSKAEVLPGKPWVDHTAGLSSHSMNATQGKSALGGVRSRAQDCSWKRKDSSSLPWKLPEKNPLLLQSHAQPSPGHRPPHGPRKSPSTSTKQSEGHGDCSPSLWGSSHGQSPGSQRAPGGNSSNRPRGPHFRASQEQLLGVRGLGGRALAFGPELFFAPARI